MIVTDFVARMQTLSEHKQVLVMQAHMDPFYYDSSDTEPNAVIIVTDDEGTIWDVIETNDDNEVINRQEIVAS